MNYYKPIFSEKQPVEELEIPDWMIVTFSSGWFEAVERLDDDEIQCIVIVCPASLPDFISKKMIKRFNLSLNHFIGENIPRFIPNWYIISVIFAISKFSEEEWRSFFSNFNFSNMIQKIINTNKKVYMLLGEEDKVTKFLRVKEEIIRRKKHNVELRVVEEIGHQFEPFIPAIKKIISKEELK